MAQKQIAKKKENIRVYVRVRPFNHKENQSRTCIESVVGGCISLKERQARDSHQFTFDDVFTENTTQQEVYDKVGRSVTEAAFEGVNGTIFCYGQTSSGKTHTCLGPNLQEKQNFGILPRLISQTLRKIDCSPKHIEAKMRVSMIEIYNEKIKDLFDQSKQDLKIRLNKKSGVFIENVTEKYILTEEEAFRHLKAGVEHRSVNATNMNATSSRSHMLFILNLDIHDVYTGKAKTSKIVLVDLAGSEKISKTGAEGKVLEEAKKINASLTALGKVINCLSDGKSTHIPYRDSKLTRLLQQSLGGNSLTNLIINVSPSSLNESETLTSIRFGNRAKAIKNQPTVNKSYTVSELLGLLQKAEIKIKEQHKLIEELTKNKKRSGGYGGMVVPKMITMHLIGDEEEESCLSFSEKDYDDESLLSNEGAERVRIKSYTFLECSDADSNSLFNTGESFYEEKIETVETRELHSKSMKKMGERDMKSHTLKNFPTFQFRKQAEKKKSVCFIDEDKRDNLHFSTQSKIPLRPIQEGMYHNSVTLHEKAIERSLQMERKKNEGSKISVSSIKDPVPEKIVIQQKTECNKQNIEITRSFSSQAQDKTQTQNNIDKIRQNLAKIKMIVERQRRKSVLSSALRAHCGANRHTINQNRCEIQHYS